MCSDIIVQDNYIIVRRKKHIHLSSQRRKTGLIILIINLLQELHEDNMVFISQEISSTLKQIIANDL